MRIFLVGGAVRDRLLGLPVTERDWVVVGATPDELLRQHYQPVGKDFPVFLHPQTKEEYALARTERKMQPGYKGFECYSAPDVTLHEDLLRRDLTINAMAEDEKGNIIDPYGGQSDIQNRLLRHVSPAFLEDPVRLLRVARFKARYHHLGFTVAEETLALMTTMVKNREVEALVAERVWQELYRALQTQHPGEFINTLYRCGALEVIFPALHALFGVPTRVASRVQDTGEWLLNLLNSAAQKQSDTIIRFALMLHRVGNAETDRTQWPDHPSFEALGEPIIQQFCEKLHTPGEYESIAQMICKYQTRALKGHSASAEDLLILLESIDSFRRKNRLDYLCDAIELIAMNHQANVQEIENTIRKLKLSYHVAKAVATKPLQEQGIKGESFAKALRECRLQAIENALYKD